MANDSPLGGKGGIREKVLDVHYTIKGDPGRINGD